MRDADRPPRPRSSRGARRPASLEGVRLGDAIRERRRAAIRIDCLARKRRRCRRPRSGWLGAFPRSSRGRPGRSAARRPAGRRVHQVAHSWGSARKQVEQVLAVRVFHRAAESFQLIGGDEAAFVGDFLQAGDFQPLPFLDRLDEIRRLQQRLVGARVEPRKAATLGFSSMLMTDPSALNSTTPYRSGS